MSSYATVTDLTNFGINPVAVANIAPATLQLQCDTASGVADGYLAGRYNMPILTPYPQDLVMYVTWIAAFLTMSVRGYNPDAGADQTIKDKYILAVEWFMGVQRQRIHPAIIQSPVAPPAFQLPQVLTRPQRFRL
jgi:phage gp36-like protein